MAEQPYSMTIDLNVLNHLGINLYSNNPAVLAEAVANAWDADAERVDIEIDAESGAIVIADDGHGMTDEDINEKFLRVGRRRREQEPRTPKFGRPVMGRKGIGKLSLFSIADTIEVQSAQNGESSGFTMSLTEIKGAIEDEPTGVYHPPPLPRSDLNVESGTRLTLRNLRKRLTSTEKNLRRRLARRFSVIGPEQRRMLFTYGVFAFEHMKAKRNLDALEELSGESLVEFGEIFTDQDDLEASLYHQIVKSRLLVIKALQNHVEADALEKVVQRHVFKSLWLLDPSWERATGTEYMEKSVASEFAEVDKQHRGKALGRVDIKYRKAAGTHVIVELKRAKVRASSEELLGQVRKYRLALRKLLEASGEQHPRIEVVCVVGESLRDWSDPGGREESTRILAAGDVRVVTYQELIDNAERAYGAFLEENRRAGRLVRLLTAIDAEE